MQSGFEARVEAAFTEMIERHAARRFSTSPQEGK